MTESKPFRARDRVTVHFGNGDTHKGRVICHNRLNKYGLSVIVLVEKDGNEFPESFKADGQRWGERDTCYITHGWPDEAQRE